MCQRGSALGFQEVDDQARFLSDIHDHWTKLSARLRTSGNILSEVVVQWQKYDALYGPMVQWLDQAEIALQSTLAQKQEFFQDLPAWNEKKKNVVESGDYLAATCRDDIASTIRAQVHSIKQRWDSLYPQMHPFLSSGESLRATQQFQTGLDNLKHWMQQAEHLLTAHVPCDVPSLEQHAEDLKRFQTTMEEQRSQYKALSRTAQVLVRDLSRTEVDKMMADMKKEKENQVRVEARCSQRLCTVTQVTSLVRALDADLDRLDRWLDKAEDAIATYAVPNTQSLVQEQLEKHRAFFSQLTPMRALLTTKNKTHREIREEVGACPGLDTSRVDARMAQLNDRFQNCASLAEQWERALQEAANRWENINDAEKKALDWLSKAEVHVSDRRDPEAARAFFSKPYEHILLRVIQTSKDVLATLPPEDHPAIEARVQHIKEKWKAVQQKLPRLNDDEIFSELRESFDRNLDTLNKELDEEQKLIDKGGNLRVILTRHEEYFNKSREMGTLQDCLEEMQQLAQSCPSHQAPLSDCQSRFRVLHERIVTTNRILQVPKDEWLEYSKKFNGLLSWMDQVDQRIEQLMQSDTSSASAYETQRTEFLDICETVDARRGDLDWLNQRLESLVPGMEPEEAKKEKERLAGLVARYGALLPVMETTTIVSETVSKCYLYREEVTQVTRWLREVRESKVVPEEIPLDSPEKLEQMVQKQKEVVEELEKRQGSVLESIKSGKDLQTVKGAPEFVSSDVKKLEEEWSQVYHEAVEKLDRMTKDSQRWQEFEKLRQEILRLLAQAEQELVNIGLLADMEQKKLEQCIKEKQEAAKKLQESMDSMLSRLRSLADELSTQLGPQRETLLRAELDKTERKTTTILTTVHETVHRLETAASKGTDLSDRLSRLSQWLDTAQDKLTAATEGPVPEQLEEVQDLSKEIEAKREVLEQIEKETQELQGQRPELAQMATSLQSQLKELDQEGKEMKQELSDRQIRIEVLRERTVHERKELEDTEANLDQGLPTPDSLEQLAAKQEQLQKLYEVTKKKIDALYDLAAEAGSDEPDLQRTLAEIMERWKQIKNILESWLESLDNTGEKWKVIVTRVEEVVTWVTEKERQMEEPLKGTTPPEMEKQKESLRNLANEVTRKQQTLSELQSNIEQLGPGLSHTALTTLHAQVSELRKRANDLATTVRQLVSQLTSQLSEREELLRRVELCHAVLNQLRQEAEEASDINMGQLEGQLRKVQTMKEELTSKKAEIETLGRTLSELSDTLAPEPSEQLLKSLESLKATLEELCKLLEKREELLQDVIKFQSWQKDFIEQVRLVQQNVESQRAKVDNLEETAKELRNLNEQLKKKVPEATSTDKLATEVQVTFRDSSTNNVTSLRGQTDKLQGHLDKVGKVLQKKQEEVTQLENKWDNFNKKLEDTKHFVTVTTETLHSLQPKSATPEALAIMVDEVEQLQKKLKEQQNVQDTTQQLGRSLIEADASCFPKVQEPLGSLASDWENLSSEVTRTLKLLGSTQSLWKECRQLENKLDDTMDKVEKTLEEVEATPAEDGKSLTENAEKVGAQQEEVRRQQPVFDSYQQKTQELIEKTEAIESLAPAGEELKESLKNREDRWRKGAQMLQSMLRDLEGRYTVWKQAELTREEILAWLEDICECMRGALDHLAQGEQGRAVLDRYETELATQQQLFANLQEQLESLEMPQALDSARSSIQCGFEEAQDLADRLHSMLSQVEEQEADVKTEMDKFSDWLRQQKEALSRCDNTTGSDEVLLQRLEECRKLEEALNKNDGLGRIEEKMARLVRNQPDLEVRHLQREQEKLKARLEAAKNQAARASAALLSILDRHHQGTLAELQHWLSTANDKLAWCSGGAEGATHGDRFGLEARLVTLQELESTLEQGEKRREQYCNSVNLLSQACAPERVPSLQDECSRICNEWTTFTSTLTQTREALKRSLDQWQHFETLFESLSDWLRDAEARAKSEAASQVDLPLLKDQISILKSLLEEVHGQKPSMQELESTVTSVTAHVPDTQVPNQVSQLAARLMHLEATLQGALAQLEQLEQTQKAFEQAKQDLRDWLSQMEASLDGCKNVPGDQKALEAHLKRLQELQKQKGAGQALLNAVVDNGESMYLSLSVESRDQVRKETRGLRDAWDSAWDKHTALVKGLESSLMAWSGFQDSCGRVSSWLADMNTLIGSDVELKPNLSEKQLQLQNIRALSQDVMSHQAVVSKLQTKSQELKETSMAGQVDGLVSDYEALCTRTKANIAQCEKRVSEHEAYQHSLERFLDWVSTLKATVDGPEEQGDMEAVKAKMAAYALVLESEPEACAKLEHLRDALESRVLPGTCPSGHEALQEQYAAARAQWEALLDACEEGHSHAKETLDRWDEATKTLDELEQWLASQRARCQDIPLQATAEAKRQQLDTLKKVEQDVVAKESDFSVLSKNAQAAPTDTMLTPQLDKLRSKYHLLRNTIKEAVAKWEKLAKQHEAFDKLLAELEEWLKQPEKELDEIVDAKADLASTQDQKNKLENLSDRLAQRSSSMDELVESGERLYSHTAPDGRETIRQQLRHVKGRWQTLVERSTEALAELDQRLQQLSGLSQSQDQLRQWIEDVKTALDSCSQPRATLQEKKAQLQTHKVVHQDILSHQPAIDSMCERAQNLSATAAGKDTLGDHVQSTKAAFQELCTRSQGLTGQLTSAVEDHQKLVDKVVAFQDWIQSFQDQLQEHKDTTGEKKAIQGRLEQLTELTEKSKEGEVLLTEVREQSQVVSARSSPQGQALLSRELQGLQELLGKTLTSLQEARRNLENTLQQWGAYESHLASLTQWLSDTEAELRAPQMPATLADKEALSTRGKELRNKIAEKQKSVDSFIDEAHCLLQLSGVELVRAQMSQCNARYQSLLATIKDLAARWEGMEKDQREYEKAVASCNAWLDEAEQTLSQIQTDKAAPEEKLTRLETLIVGKVHGQQQLNLASRLGEHLYQDTAATGRDQVRLELRELHERWDSLESKIADLQKQLQLQSHARSSFVDSLSQVQMWLDNAERTVAEARDKLPSLQEAQGRLHSLKLLQQEAVLQRRQLDSLEEMSRGDASSKESLETTSTRLGIVTEELKTLLAGLERLSALAQEQRERKEQLAAWLEQMRERLDLCRDVTGSRPVLKTRLDKLQELEKQQPEGTCKAQALAECTATLVTLLTPRERATLEQESGTLEGSVARLGAEVEQARHALSAQLRLWDAYEEHYERLLGWLQGAEQTVQQFALQATLDEKRQQLDKFQSLLSELHATERDFDSLSDKAQELMVSSGEMRLSMAVGQLTARFQSLLETCKELVKKCEQHVQDHSQLEKKHAECAKTLAQAQEAFVEIQALPSGNKERLSHKLARVKELLQGKSEALNLVNATVQLADQVQVGSSPEGWKAIQGLLQQLQSAYEAVFDKAQNLERVLQSSQFLWSEYHEALQRLQTWLKGLAAKAEGASRLCTTLDEKKAHLRTCRGLLAELNEREQAIEDIQIKAEAIADRDNESQEMLEGVVKGHKEQTQKLQEAVKFLEDAVTQHEQLSKHLGNVRDWLSSTQEQAVALSNLGLDQLALYSNLERLKRPEDQRQPNWESQLPGGRSHQDVPGLCGHPDGLCSLKATAQHAENPEPRQTGGARTMLERPPGMKRLADSLLSITTNDQRGGTQGDAVRTTGLQEQARPTAAVTAEATTGEAMTQGGTAAKTVTR
ncbi:muscle-specific protein 300 kDa [Rhipicephalus sanguineus]|uniref:muscle-specific protein 300 kDa n=1 Tax=Rhipicephalus sanguineus TaxID=34632 RepID=UPI0020C504B5|nr:muscle-specific protein 300 kDa [Rhipicephalus sanguineus]